MANKKETAVAKVTEEKKDGLVVVIRNDKNLQKDHNRMILFISMANIYEQDFSENLELDSVSLEDKYINTNGITRTMWMEFLNYGCVKKYLQTFVDERLTKNAERALSKEELTASNALKLKANIEGKNKADNNDHIIVFFLPLKDFKL